MISLHHGAGVSRRIQLLIVLLECLCASLTTSYEPAKYRKKSHSPAIHRRRCTDQSLQLLKLRPSRTVTDREAIIVTSEIPRDKFLQCGRFTCITLLVHQQLRNRFNKRTRLHPQGKVAPWGLAWRSLTKNSDTSKTPIFGQRQNTPDRDS